MLHFGKLDHHIPKESIDAVQAANPEVPVFSYDAATASTATIGRATARKLEKERSLKFMKKHLG
jgi:carboxymethylenebutenolidase